MTIKEIHKVVSVLIGDINPVGCFCVDKRKLDSVKKTCELIDVLLNNLTEMACSNQNSYESSVLDCVEHVEKFKNSIVRKISYPESEELTVDSFSNQERNNIHIGGWCFDTFITKDKNLGFTVYEYQKNSDDENCHCADFFVDKNNVHNVRNI